ncbi:MAG: carbon-nitrogen hydrolase family protein [Acidobacteria bacterium]|nr:carbon-nitrogen hydrolase family protein [Acidobacteriota bacterium]
MKIALVQQHAITDKRDNLKRGLIALKEAAAAGAKLVCYAELAFEPFYPQELPTGDIRELAEPVPGPITEAFIAEAKRLGIVVVLNLFELEGDKTYDCSPVIDADGSLIGKTRMVHVPDYKRFHEQHYYTPGDLGAPVFNTACGRIGIAICYDRHYPEYIRALKLNGAELVIIPQAGAVGEWPDGLYEAEMRVAAFQNGYFTALCNRVGKEPAIEFAGESFVCDPKGRVIAKAATGRDEILYCDVDFDEIPGSAAELHFLPDRRPEDTGGWQEK